MDAEKCVTEQIKAHAMHDRVESWLSEGLRYIQDDSCPFCGQTLDNATTIIGDYKVFFSEAYKTLRADIDKLRDIVEERFGDRAIAVVEKLLDQNTSNIEFWSRYCKLESPSVGSDEVSVADALRSIREAAVALLNRKAATPLDQILLDSTFTAAKAAFDSIYGNKRMIYNQAVLKANTIITSMKATIEATDIRDVERSLTNLHDMKKRHEPITKEACDKYVSAQSEKKELTEEKEAIKKELDDLMRLDLGRYEQTINRLLNDFNAGFRITKTRHGYPGGIASSSYQILINNTAVEVGDKQTPLNRSSFRNTLSSGDKSTLALAFFLAQLEFDSDRSEKIVIFDDPFSSQDSFRRSHTAKKIKECGKECSQVLILSHDDQFLKLVWDQLARQPADRKSIKFERIGQHDTTVSDWDIEIATQDPFLSDRQALVDYYNKANIDPINSRDIVTKIRPVLETYIRNICPSQFNQADSLGTIIRVISDTGASSPLFKLRHELDLINKYTTPFSHGRSDPLNTQIDDNELYGFVKKTLNITGGC